MSFDSYSLQFNNGKKGKLNEAKSGVRRDNIHEKFHNLFNAYDMNQDGTLEENELEKIFTTLSSFAGSDKVLDSKENDLITSLFLNGHIELKPSVDFMGFVKSVTDASAEIESSKESPAEDGGKTIVTKYKDGTIETIGYYPDGEFKYKKTEKMLAQTHYYVEMNGFRQEVNEEQYKQAEKRLKELEANQAPWQKTDGVSLNYNPSISNIKITTETLEEPEIKYDFSSRSSFDINSRAFILNHYIESYQNVKANLDTMGLMDDIGALINSGAGEIWQPCVNLFKKYFGDGTQKDYQNFYELVRNFKPKYENIGDLQSNLKIMHSMPERFFENFETDIIPKTGNNYDLFEVAKFQNLAEQYQTAQILTGRISLLKQALKSVLDFQQVQTPIMSTPEFRDGTSPANHMKKAYDYLLSYFDNDEDAANLLLDGIIDNPQKTLSLIKSLIEQNEKQLNETLIKKELLITNNPDGTISTEIEKKEESYTLEELKEKYQSEFKNIYNTDFVPEILNDRVMGAKMTGGMAKIGIITIISILITKSPAMSEVMKAAGGATVVQGRSALFIQNLVSKYGVRAVQQGVKFAMSTGTLATDVGLTILNQLTDNRKGINGEELLEGTKGAAKYIYFGAFVGSPLAQAVTQRVGKLGMAGKIFKGGVKTTQGAITKTTIKGSELVKNFMSASESLLAKGAGFATDIGAFTLLDITTEDLAPDEAFATQAEMLTTLRIMHKAFEYMLGAKTHTALQKAQWEAAIEESGIKNWNIQEIKVPDGTGKGYKTIYDVDVQGVPIGRVQDPNLLVAAMVGRVSDVYRIMTESKPVEEKTEKIVKNNVPENNFSKKPVSEMSEAEMIERYNYLITKQGQSQEIDHEILELTFELQDKNYTFKDGKLDFTYKTTDETLPNSNVTKVEFLKGLKERGITQETIEIIEFNINRINMEFLKALQEYPELLNSPFGVGILCDVKAEDLPAKIKMLQEVTKKDGKVLKHNEEGDFYTKEDASFLSAEAQLNLIGMTTKDNIATLETRLAKAKADLAFLQENYIFDYNEQLFINNVVEANWEFNREAFLAFKDIFPESVTKTELCFNVETKDIGVKEKVAKILHETGKFDEASIFEIIPKVTEENISKLKLLLEKNIYDKNILSRIDRINTELLETIKNDQNFERYIDRGLIENISSEDAAAKAEIYNFILTRKAAIEKGELGESAIDVSPQRRHYLEMATAENLDRIKLAIELGITKLQTIEKLAKMDIAVLETFGQDKTNLNWILSFISVEKVNKINPKLIPAFKGQPARFRDAVNDEILLDITEEQIPLISKAIEYSKAGGSDAIKFAIRRAKDPAMKAMVEEEYAIYQKLISIKEMTEPNFSLKEQVERRNKLKEIFDFIDSQKGITIEGKEKIKAAFESAKCMEELNAKYEKLKTVPKTDSCLSWIQTTFILEQVEVYNKTYDQMLLYAFPLNYSIAKQIDKSRSGISPSFELLSLVKNQSDLDFAWQLGNSKISHNARLKIMSDLSLREAYLKLTTSLEYKKLSTNDKSILTDALCNGQTIDLSNIGNSLLQIKAKDVLSSIQDYRTKLSIGSQEVGQTGSHQSEVRNTLSAFKLQNVEKFYKYDSSQLDEILKIFTKDGTLSFEEIGKILDSGDFSKIQAKKVILDRCKSDVRIKLAGLPIEEFNKVVEIIERRPEILTETFDWGTFERMLKMSDKEWTDFKISIKDRTATEFDEASYAKEIQAKLDAGYTTDLRVWQGIERSRLNNSQDQLGNYSQIITASPKTTAVETPVPELPTVEACIKQLSQTGKVEISIEDRGGMKPALTDPAQIKDKDRPFLGQVRSTDISLNIGATRSWENERLARDLLQNFYDGNGYTLEGVSISVETLPNGKYSIKISGKGIFDYDRVLDFGATSKEGDPRSAGRHGEGSKVITGNLLLSSGTENVKYSSGNWELTLTKGEGTTLGTTEIMQKLTEAQSFQEGTSLEFQTDNIDLVKAVMKAKDYFYSPYNKDFANFDFENELFGIKILPKGEKGNLYMVQRYEVESTEGLDGVLDGITLVFKTQPNDKRLMELHNGVNLDLSTGRNRIGINKYKIKDLIERYAATMENQQLIDIISQMQDIFLYDNNHNSTFILEGFIKEASKRKLKIDFGHDTFIAVPEYSEAEDISFVRTMGKIPVVADLQDLGVPSLYQYLKAAKGQRTPKLDLTQRQNQRLQILEEATAVFAEALDFSTAKVITVEEARAPRYVFEAKRNDNHAQGEAIVDKEKTYSGHWVSERYVNEGNFYRMLATWLHEISHKIDGDGSVPFNERLILLEKIIIDLTAKDPSFGKKLSILEQKFKEVSGENTTVGTKSEFVLSEYEERLAKLLENAAIEAKRAEELASTKSMPQEERQAPLEDPTRAIWTEVQPVKNYEFLENPLPTYKELRRTLETSGEITIEFPTSDHIKPVKGDTKINAEDRLTLGQRSNTRLMLDYNNAQEWNYDTIARDLLQNFYDGHGGTLDGVKIEIVKAKKGKYKIKISGDSEFNSFYLKVIGASTKTEDVKQAGGFGEGAKMASKTMLSENMTDEIVFASGEWKMSFMREDGVPRKNMHMTKCLTENTERVNGNYVEFTTDNEALVEAIIKSKDYFKHSANPDFVGLDFETDKFGFKILPGGTRGNLYYNQRFRVKNEGDLETPLKGLRIVFKEGVSQAEALRLNIANDCDRIGLTYDEIQQIAKLKASELTQSELLSLVKTLEDFYVIDNPKAFIRSHETTAEMNFALGILKAAQSCNVKIDTKGLKLAALGNCTEAEIEYLQKEGYTFVHGEMAKIGVKRVDIAVAELRSVRQTEKTLVERQKIKLLEELLPKRGTFTWVDAEYKMTPITIKVFENLGDKPNVYYNEGFVFIDKNYLAKADFNTLYSEIISYMHKNAGSSSDWGYAMTDMIGEQLQLSTDTDFRAKFNAVKAKYEALGNE